jgi:hypothetical protein
LFRELAEDGQVPEPEMISKWAIVTLAGCGNTLGMRLIFFFGGVKHDLGGRFEVSGAAV